MVSVLFISFLVCLAVGVPVAFSLGVSSMAYFISAGLPMVNFSQYFFKGLDSFTLLCIPGFTFAGNLMNQGGIAKRLVNFVLLINFVKYLTIYTANKNSAFCTKNFLKILCFDELNFSYNLMSIYKF